MALRFLATVYAGHYAEADRLLRLMAKPASANRYTHLFRSTDLRKFTLACFRDYLRTHPRLTDEAALLLYRFSRLFDAVTSALTPESEEQEAKHTIRAPLQFDKVARLTRAPIIKIIGKKFYYGPDSRIHDIGPRMVTAFESAGARCRFVDPLYDPHEFEDCDLALVDDEYLERYICERDQDRKRRFLDRLRKSARKMALIDFDPWASRHDTLRKRSQAYDFIWAMLPALAQHGKLSGVPICVAPFPVGFSNLFEALPKQVSSATAAIRFCGAVEEAHFTRYLWLLASHTMGPTLDYEVTSHVADGQAVEESLRRYLTRLTATPASLSFTMRANGMAIAVGRSFDVIAAGRLLVQEATSDMPYYFSKGEHYLEFGSVEELKERVAMLDRPDIWRPIAARGYAYFSSQYSDDAVLRHLATFL